MVKVVGKMNAHAPVVLVVTVGNLLNTRTTRQRPKASRKHWWQR